MTPGYTDRTAWVRERLGVELHDDGRSGLGLAVRRNPRRAQLLVNPALAKHVPIVPRVARDAAAALAEVVRSAAPVTPRTLVIGFAETATGIGHLVAEALQPVDLIATTRVFDRDLRDGHLAFDEEHSHAVAQRLTPHDPALLHDRPVMVLVDDELTTGRTALNTVRQLATVSPGATFVVATLVDARPPADREEFAALAAAWGLRVVVVSLHDVALDVPAGTIEAVAGLPDFAQPYTGGVRATGPRVETMVLPLPPAVMAARAGIAIPSVAHESTARGIVGAVMTSWTPPPGGHVHVLGDEETIHLPLRVAELLSEQWADRHVTVVVSSTTRSPIVVIDDPGYAIRLGIAHEVQGEPRFAYNVSPTSDAVVFVPEPIVSRLGDHADLLARIPVSLVLAVDWR